MGIDRRAEAYARQFAPLFVSRYIDAVKAGHSKDVPPDLLPSIRGYVNGTTEGAGVDAQTWVYNHLYTHRVRTGRDADLPPEYSGSSAGATAAKVAGAVALGIGGALLKGGLGLARRGLFR